VNIQGAMILLIGLWAVMLPVFIIRAVRHREKVAIALVVVPSLWFLIGFLASVGL
jgi:hypothetical protein